MNILINYFGQPRNIPLCENVYNLHINDKINTFHVCYSTWNTEDIVEFSKIFPSAFIMQYDYPDITKYQDIINNYKYEHYSRDISHYVYGLKIRENSINTIDEYIRLHSINIDFIINIRTDTDIYTDNFKDEGILYRYYNLIIKDTSNVYLANKPRFDIYNVGAIPDALIISNYNNTKSILTFPDFSSITAYDKIIHPESATGKMIINNNINKIFLNMHAFRWQKIRLYC